MSLAEGGRVIVLSPRGRDAVVIAKLLERDGLQPEIASDFQAWAGSIDASACVAIVTEEAMTGVDMAPLFGCVDGQPPWSDFPFIVLVTRQAGVRSRSAARTIERLGNVILLERPINAETLSSAVASALRSRRRQYQARSHLAERETAQEALRLVNDSLERRVEERTCEVEAARETLAFALDSAGMGTWDLDLVNDTARRNRHHDSIFGFDDVEGKWGLSSFLDHVHGDERAGVRDAMEAAMRTGSLDLECRILQRSGEIRWISAKGRVDYDAAGAPIRMAGIVMDRTRQQNTEQALRQAQKMEAIGQLTGGVAHDFNNLLTVIRSSVDLLRRPGIAEERKARYLDAMSDTVDRAAKLTGQLLAFSRRQSLMPEVFDVGRRLGGVVDMIDTLSGARIRVLVEAPSEPCFVRADVSQFETALVNVAVNARDAMDGEGSFKIRLARIATLPSIRGHAGSSEPFVSVTMTDTGCGIEADKVVRIFEPFFTTKEVGKGTGLGLSQVFGFAKQSGGDVDVTSEVGSGTTFTLYLPEVAVEGSIERLDDGPIGFSEGGDGRHVLVVEDNLGVGEFCTQILGDLGYRTTWAANAEEALERLGESGVGFDAVFSDVVMPGMGGVALAKEMQERLPFLPVLLTSGYSHVLAEDADHGFALLRKPYSAEQLARTLNKVMRQRRRVPLSRRT